MQDYSLYEYAIVRWVPQVEREEFMNIGVVLFCAKQKFLAVDFHVDKAKMLSFNSMLDSVELEGNFESFKAICEGKKCASPIASLDLPSRFRWLTATRSTILQCSKVHSGFCENPQITLLKIMKEMVI